MIADLGGHRGRISQRFVNPCEVVVYEVQRYGIDVTDFLAEAVCQPRESSHPMCIVGFSRSTNDELGKLVRAAETLTHFVCASFCQQLFSSLVRRMYGSCTDAGDRSRLVRRARSALPRSPFRNLHKRDE